MPMLSSYLDQHLIAPYLREAEEPLREPYVVGARRLLDYLLIYMQEGQFVMYAEGREYVVKPGEFCLIQPQVLHSFTGLTDTITPYIHFDVFYRENRKDSFPTKQGQTDLTSYEELVQPILNEFDDVTIPVVFKPAKSVVCRDLLLKAIRQWLQGDTLRRLEASNLVAQLIWYLLEEYSSLHTPREDRTGDFLSWIHSYMSLHLAESLSISKMAKRARCSPSRFSMIFRNHFGLSPHQYVMQMRIDHARDMLVNSELSMVQIATYCGFSDIHHFSKIFKQRTQATPSNYRFNAKSSRFE